MRSATKQFESDTSESRQLADECLSCRAAIGWLSPAYFYPRRAAGKLRDDIRFHTFSSFSFFFLVSISILFYFS